MALIPGELHVEKLDGMIAVVEIRRPPNNFFDVPLIRAIAGVYAELDQDPECRAIVLCSEGKHFCAGADFRSSANGANTDPENPGRHLYDEAVRLWESTTPVVAAVQGAAVGGGVGLALSADFRVMADDARFSMNFARLGSHQGFALSETSSPRSVVRRLSNCCSSAGPCTPRRHRRSAYPIGSLRPRRSGPKRSSSRARSLTRPPLSVSAIRRTLRGDLVTRVAAALALEKREQDLLRGTADRNEGIRASLEHREPRFIGA